MNGAARLLRRIRVLLGVFMLGLVVGGLTAIPLEWEARRDTQALLPLSESKT